MPKNLELICAPNEVRANFWSLTLEAGKRAAKNIATDENKRSDPTKALIARPADAANVQEGHGFRCAPQLFERRL
jgi:hypothetical protein